ncbi:MAG: hypothetical protein JRI68_28680 [Deltaproteobacteria bacterium]|nr:hypothetical protein [Deltaproteobacteria bacterium]
MSENRSAAAVLGCLLGALVCVGGGGIVVLVFLWPPSDTATAPVPVPPGPGPAAAPTGTSSRLPTAPATAERSSPFGPLRSAPSAAPVPSGPPKLPPDMRRAPIALPDLKHVDPQQLFAPAKQIAQELEPQVELSFGFPVSTHGGLVGGTIDLAGQNRVHFDYQYRYAKPGEPPGKDVDEGSIVVVATRGHLTASREGHGVHFPQGHESIPAPTCTVVRAWQVAVGSGVPGKAVARVMYYDQNPFNAGGPYVWSFRVAGHDEHRREIDGLTCALVKSWAKGR